MKYILTQICEYSLDQRLLVVDEDKSIIVFESKADANDFIERTGENPENIMIIPEMEFISCGEL
tara:strand:+ start:220 stop:411 length:192 start_codon:yes stop_codon:yes gene_type:complete